MKPTVTISIGRSRLAGVGAIRVLRTVGAVAGVCQIEVPAPVRLRASPGDPVATELDAGAGANRVFTGILDSLAIHADRTALRAMDARLTTARRRVNSSFANQSSDTIIRALAAEAAILTGALAPGLPLLSYTVDDGRTVLGHIERLAALGGADVWVDVRGFLRTSSYVPSPPTQLLRFGRHVAAVDLESRGGAGPVEVRTEGAASLRGLRAAFWPASDTSTVAGRAPGQGSKDLLWEPALRTMLGAARCAAARMLERRRRRHRVRVRCLGAPTFELGDTLILADVPGAPAALPLQVLGIEHRLNAREGFVTELSLAGAGP